MSAARPSYTQIAKKRGKEPTLPAGGAQSAASTDLVATTTTTTTTACCEHPLMAFIISTSNSLLRRSLGVLVGVQASGGTTTSSASSSAVEVSSAQINNVFNGITPPIRPPLDRCVGGATHRSNYYPLSYGGAAEPQG